MKWLLDSSFPITRLADLNTREAMFNVKAAKLDKGKLHCHCPFDELSDLMLPVHVTRIDDWQTSTLRRRSLRSRLQMQSKGIDAVQAHCTYHQQS